MLDLLICRPALNRPVFTPYPRKETRDAHRRNQGRNRFHCFTDRICILSIKKRLSKTTSPDWLRRPRANLPLSIKTNTPLSGRNQCRVLPLSELQALRAGSRAALP